VVSSRFCNPKIVYPYFILQLLLPLLSVIPFCNSSTVVPPIPADSASAVSVICGIPWPEKKIEN
jgi:hypothetical protein